MTIPVPVIADAKPASYCRVFKKIAKRVPGDLEKAQTAAQGLWPQVGRRGVDPAAMGCDDDLIALGLAKDDGGIVYLKFDLSGWDE